MTHKVEIKTTEAAPPAARYSQGVTVTGKLHYVSGMIGNDPQTNKLKGETIEEQTVQVFANITAVLKAAGLGLKDAVRFHVYLTDMGNFAAFNKVFAECVQPIADAGSCFPARTCIAVKALPMNALVEIDTIAASE